MRDVVCGREVSADSKSYDEEGVAVAAVPPLQTLKTQSFEKEEGKYLGGGGGGDGHYLFLGKVSLKNFEGF